MFKKLALKRLTASDLTFFVWHFRNQTVGNQKAINLNADVFVNELYPSLPETEQARSGRIPLDLYIFGPGAQSELNITRKIVKGSTYKNWRLNGEFVDDPDHPDRFNSLAHGDFVVFEFTGELLPIAAKAIFIARASAEDFALHAELERTLGGKSMIAVESDALANLIIRANTPDNHPINELILDDALEDVALGGSEGAQRLLHRRSGRKLTKDQLRLAREKIDEIGYQGEGWVNEYLLGLQNRALILSFAWVSEENAISPYDFRVVNESSEAIVNAKSTTGPFNRTIHISVGELREMANAPQRYDIYRIFEMTDSGAKLRIFSDTRDFAANILSAFEDLPPGVLVDAVSLDPASLPFEDTIRIVFEGEETERAI